MGDCGGEWRAQKMGLIDRERRALSGEGLSRLAHSLATNQPAHSMVSQSLSQSDSQSARLTDQLQNKLMSSDS